MKKDLQKIKIFRLLCGTAGLILLLTVTAVLHLQGRGKILNNIFIDDTVFDKEIARAALYYDLPPALVKALIRKESGFYAGAVGKDGEIGLMQVHPGGAVAEWARIKKILPPAPAELFDVELNLDIGCWYLAAGIKRYENYRCCVELALARYNAGAKNSDRWKPSDPSGDVISRIDFPGTKEYVQRIMKEFRKSKKQTEACKQRKSVLH